MAQPNVAREPSMDEILASIRRIIESNDPPVGAPPVLSAISGDAGVDEDSFDDEMIVADFHAQEALSAAASAVVHSPASIDRASADPVDEPRVQPAMSLADVAARVRAASERNGMMLREQPARPLPSEEPVSARGEPAFDAPVSPASNVMAMVPPSVAKMPQQEQQAERSQPVAAPAFMDEPYRPEAPAARTSPPVSAAALVSAAVGAQVASSFGALAEAVEAGPRRSFDDIAKEMLRPMLQEWLDDNLPTLVERLVREEIERVARGPRR
jgi:cell pole-organizing protein PopZ